MYRTLSKYEFKICEAVHLGLDYYYMGKKNKLAITDKDIEIARQILPTLPDKWWLKKYYGMTMRH